MGRRRAEISRIRSTCRSTSDQKRAAAGVVLETAARDREPHTHRKGMSMSSVVYGNGPTIEKAIADAIGQVDQNHFSAEVRRISFEQGGVRGGTEFRVEVRLVG